LISVLPLCVDFNIIIKSFGQPNQLTLVVPAHRMSNISQRRMKILAKEKWLSLNIQQIKLGSFPILDWMTELMIDDSLLCNGQALNLHWDACVL